MLCLLQNLWVILLQKVTKINNRLHNMFLVNLFTWAVNYWWDNETSFKTQQYDTSLCKPVAYGFVIVNEILV